MHKWRMENGLIKLLCDSCSKKQYDDLVIREAWKASDTGKMVTCEDCGETKALQREGKV